jgi:hypothetical protein
MFRTTKQVNTQDKATYEVSMFMSIELNTSDKHTNRSKTLFIAPTDAQYYKTTEMLKQFKNYNICSDMFRFTQEP